VIDHLGMWMTTLEWEKIWCAPELLDRFKCEFKVKTTEDQGVGAHSLACSTLGVEGHAIALGWD